MRSKNEIEIWQTSREPLRNFGSKKWMRSAPILLVISTFASCSREPSSDVALGREARAKFATVTPKSYTGLKLSDNTTEKSNDHEAGKELEEKANKTSFAGDRVSTPSYVKFSEIEIQEVRQLEEEIEREKQQLIIPLKKESAAVRTEAIRAWHYETHNERLALTRIKNEIFLQTNFPHRYTDAEK